MEEDLKINVDGNLPQDKPQSASERARAFLAGATRPQSGAGVVLQDSDGAGAQPEGQIAGVDPLVQAGSEGRRGEVSAATIGRMLGLVTSADLQIIEKKIDLLTTKLNLIAAKVDKFGNSLSELPSGADFERIEVQLVGLRNLIKEALVKSPPDGVENDRQLSKAKIQSNQPQIFGGKVITRIQPKEES